MKRKISNAVAVLVLAVAGCFSTVGQTNTTSFTFSITNAIPDGNASGYVNSQTISGLDGTIADLNITLNLSGGFNGDLYVYLTHGNTSIVLLNRVGKSSTSPFGYEGGGLSIRLDDQAGSNIHWYETASPTFNGSGQLLGSWQPDGRTTDPDLVDETSVPLISLSAFNGQSPNGTWTLFAADLSDGEQAVLLEWGFEVATVPEPSTAGILFVGGGLFALARHRRNQQPGNGRD